MIRDIQDTTCVVFFPEDGDTRQVEMKDLEVSKGRTRGRCNQKFSPSTGLPDSKWCSKMEQQSDDDDDNDGQRKATTAIKAQKEQEEKERREKMQEESVQAKAKLEAAQL